MNIGRWVWAGGAGALALACGAGRPVEPAPPVTPTETATKLPPPGADYRKLSRERVNLLALRLNLPLFWELDRDGDGAIDPDEVRSLGFYPTQPRWVEQGRFTSDFQIAYEQLLEAERAGPPKGDDAESERRRLVIEDLEQGRPTLVHSDLTQLPPAEKTFVRHMLGAAQGIDELYAWQTGARALRSRAASVDIESQSLFRRNRGPKCRGPKTERDPKCSALPGAPALAPGVWNGKIMTPATCAALEKDKNAKQLLAPFTALVGEGDAAQPVPYTRAVPGEMAAVAKELSAAADALKDTRETTLVAYLRAAAASFGTNDWESADEAWSKMTGKSSRWYLRVGPDETYWDPCNRKAGFHLTLAVINRDSLTWQEKLAPALTHMEGAMAKLAGAPYRARDVKFHLPDFIDIAINAGDDRDAFGATIGQSLPNWGKVAAENRGRTVAMTNLYGDPDSKRSRREQAASLLTKETLQSFVDDAMPSLLGTILHEATHNLGPSHEYKYRGKTDDEAFGGALAQMLEELKAQTGALFYLGFLHNQGVIDAELMRQAYVDSIVWAFGHISRGMWTEDKQRKSYSQLAAIQVGALMDAGVLRFGAQAMAANGTDRGAFSLDLEKLPGAAEDLMKTVARIKAVTDKKAALSLSDKYVDGSVVPFQLITERVLRHPKASFVYSIDL